MPIINCSKKIIEVQKKIEWANLKLTLILKKKDGYEIY